VSERGGQASPSLWAARAGVTERAIYARHLRRLWGVPGTMLGVVGWPASNNQRAFGHWHYWWQAHVLDCLIDAQLRAPSDKRKAAIERQVNGIHRRNLGTWLNDYYDDVAWLGLALMRAEQYAGIHRPDAIRAIAARLRSGWTDHGGGGIWWRRREKFADDFKNVPSNGPAAILLTRLVDSAANDQGDRADRQRARSTVEWIEEFLIEEETGLVFDGLHVYPNGEVRERENAIYTYCQGVFLGACVELATRDSVAGGGTWAARAVRTIDAVARHVTVPDELGLVLRGQGGGDGGLFAGILARYPRPGREPSAGAGRRVRPGRPTGHQSGLQQCGSRVAQPNHRAGRPAVRSGMDEAGGAARPHPPTRARPVRPGGRVGCCWRPPPALERAGIEPG